MPAPSGEEWLDVVDRDDRVVGRATRRDVHARGLRHRSVHVLLYDSEERLFVQRRSLAKDTNPGLWDTSAAGHVDAGEPCATAALRELGEELGVHVDRTSLQALFTLAPEPSNGNEFVRVYRVRSDQPLTLETAEIDDGVWLAPDALAERLATDPDSFTAVFRAIVAR